MTVRVHWANGSFEKFIVLSYKVENVHLWLKFNDKEMWILNHQMRYFEVL